MAIVFTCPRCDRRYSVSDAMAGRRVVCKGCQQEFGVPGKAATASSWDEDDGPEIAFAAPPPTRPRPSATPSTDEDDGGTRRPARAKAKSGARSSSSGRSSPSIGQYGIAIVGVIVAVIALGVGRSYLGIGGNTPRANDAIGFVRERAGIMNEMSALLERVDDPDAAVSLQGQFQELDRREKDLKMRVLAFGGITKAEDAYVRRQMATEMREALTRLKITLRKFEAYPAAYARLAFLNAGIDKDLKEWGGPTREIPTTPVPIQVPGLAGLPAPTSTVTAAPMPPKASTPEIPADADAVTRSLIELKSTEANPKMQALKRLLTTPPNDRAAEIAAAVAPLMSASGNQSFLAPDAVKVLVAWPCPESIESLCNGVSSDNILVRNESMQGLGKLKAPNGIAPILTRIVPDAYNAKLALTAYGSEAEAPLIALLKDDDYKVRAAACEILSVVGGKDTLKAMNDLPPDAHPYTMSQAKSAYLEIVKRVGPLPGTAKAKGARGKGKS